MQCARKKLAGVYGMGMRVQSAEYSPVVLEARLLEFLDQFYHEQFTKEAYETYRQGTIDRKLAGYRTLAEETEFLYARIRHFKHGEDAFIEWNRREKEVECIKEYCTYEVVKSFYKNLICPSE